MASLRTLLSKLHLNINTETASALRGCYQKNGMSQYPQYYIKPFPKKDVQQSLVETGEFLKLAHIPTRAALMDQTSSYRQNDLINLFINYVMRDGRKELARTLVYRAFDSMKRIQMAKYWKCEDLAERQTIELDPRVIFFQAIENCKPLLNLMPIKRGGVRYQVPVPITEKQQQFLSMKWLIFAANDKDKRPQEKVKTRKKDQEPREYTRFYDQLARELIDAYENKGRVIKKKQDLHRMCEANRAYAHYRWS